MKELWYRYDDGNGSTGTASLYICQPCIDEMEKHVEDEVIGYEDFGIEVEADDVE
jgi:hypothetical protein